MIATFAAIATIVLTLVIVAAWGNPLFIIPGVIIFVLIDRYWMGNPHIGETFQALLGLLGLVGIIAGIVGPIFFGVGFGP